LLCCAVVTWLGCAAPGSFAAQSVALQAQFSPDKLGVATTIEFGFRVSETTPGSVPSPVIGVDIDLPAGMGLASSTLGLAICQPAILLEYGPRACPANAHVGSGIARGQLRAGGEVVTEVATVQALLGPRIDEDEQVLFFVEATEPVYADLVFPGQLLPATSASFSGRLRTVVPLVAGWLGGPDVAVTSFSSTLGPRGLTYYRHVAGGFVPFHPKGIEVPEHCPRGGFPFAARLTFLDGTSAATGTAVPCPS